MVLPYQTPPQHGDLPTQSFPFPWLQECGQNHPYWMWLHGCVITCVGDRLLPWQSFTFIGKHTVMKKPLYSVILSGQSLLQTRRLNLSK